MATAKVVFATITGNNEDVADIVAQELEKRALRFQLKKFPKQIPKTSLTSTSASFVRTLMTKERFLMKVLIFTMILKMSI